MSWLTGGLISESTRLRSALRKAGVTGHLARLRNLLGSKDYELQVDRALSSLLRPGDCVWDVGANVGLYTERFAEAVGPGGKVVAFEPIGSTYQALLSRTQSYPWVQARNEALGASSASLTIALEHDPTSPTNSLTRTASPQRSQHTQTVHVVTGD
ncbi:MAG TPA: FkbM family methyltransferase, partial [Polyangiales bacterium]